MNSRLRQLLLGTTISVFALITACSPSPSSEEQQGSPIALSSSQSKPTQVVEPSPLQSTPKQSQDSIENVGNSRDDGARVANVAPAAAVECVSWPQYKTDASDPTVLPNMPTGFENSCIFGTNLDGQSGNDLVSIYILRDDMPLDQVLAPSVLASASMDFGIPNVDSRAISESSGESSKLADEITNGNVVLFHYGDPRSCEMIGGLHPDGYYNTRENNCGFASPQRAYISFDDHPVACFGVSCVETYGDISEEALLDLWEPWQVPVANSAINAVRAQYNTIDLKTLSPELRQAIFRFDVEPLLMQEFGRTILEEGEQPTAINQDDSKGNDYWYLHIATVTNEGLADDSVGGFRYRLEFEPYDGDTLLLVWAGKQQYCRRTGEWTYQLCP